MPNYRKGNMFEYMKLDKEKSWGGWFYVTANSTIKNNGELVMGRGAALTAKRMFPKVPIQLGKVISSMGKATGQDSAQLIYGLASCFSPSCPVHAFQVKYHFKDKASLALIALSCHQLGRAFDPRTGEGQQAHVNFPGIGYGGLSRAEVKPILDMYLPKTVNVWELN